MKKIEAIKFTPIDIYYQPSGSLKRFLKSEELESVREIYFSTVAQNAIKGWKRHREMTLNLTVVAGVVRFYFVEELELGPFDEITLGGDLHGFITVPPFVWVAFEGLADTNAICNAASIEHNPLEYDSFEFNPDHLLDRN